jgi:uncharacterized cupredoxin-like copper-binding protein/mono/diheme cytochrome c family protein
VGAVQKLATVVIVGLVALATVLVLYLADESNRIKAEEKSQQHDAIERAIANYVSLCLACHGPAGEGYTAPGEARTGRIGAALGGINTSLNQQGINARGTPYPGGVAARATVISDTIHNGLPGSEPGTYRMPPWSESKGGPLNDAQIEELVTMIQHVDWNEVYNHAIEVYGGYPTAPPAATEAPQNATPQPSGTPTTTGATQTVELHDIFFDPKEITIPANTEVTITLVNKGAAPHTFDIDALNVHSGEVAPGATTTVTINAPAGDYDFYCAIPGHKEAGMVGTLHVVEGAAAPANESQGPPPTEGAPPASQAPIEVDMVDIAFAPAEITIPANTDVTINLVNKGSAVHTFDVDELNVHSGEYAGGQTGTVTINAAPGEYEYYCAVPGHKQAGMVGKLIVK